MGFNSGFKGLISSTCFEHYPAHLQDVYVVIVCIYIYIYIYIYICSLWYRHLQTVTIPDGAYMQLRRRPPEDEQGNARNMQRILINVLYINK